MILNIDNNWNSIEDYLFNKKKNIGTSLKKYLNPQII